MTDEQIHELALCATNTYYMRSGKVHFDNPNNFIDEFSDVYALAVEIITNKQFSEQKAETDYEKAYEKPVKEKEEPKKYIISSSNSIRSFLA